MKVWCGSSASPRPAGPGHQLERQRREQRLQLGELLGVVGGEARAPNQLQTPSAAFCAATSSPDALSASASSWSISARVKGRLGVPCLDEAARAGHHHVHVGVAGRVLDVVEVEQRRALDDAHRDGGHEVADRAAAISLPASSQLTASCAATRRR
jgi:hypothetical protein